MARRATGFGKQDGGGRRSMRRVRAPLPALLVTMSDRHAAILYNISETGALLRADDTPAEGTELLLQVASLEVYSHIAWRRDQLCGLKFDHPVRAWDVEILRCEAEKGTQARLTAAEKGGADDWATGVAR